MLDQSLGRVAMISLHTSPLDQPGTGDAGGMNVYVIELARQLAKQRIEVDIFTRATTSALPPVVEAGDGIRVRHITAGPFEGLTKGELPGQLCVFAREVLRAEAAQPVGHYDIVHSHYWLSGQVGALARDRWGVPLVHSMHTMAKVKNDALAIGDTPEPDGPDHRRGAGRRGGRHADRQHRHRGQAADQPVRRRPGPGRGRPPRRGPVGLPPDGPGRGAGGRSTSRQTHTSCCSPAGSSRSRRPTCCCGRWRSCSRRPRSSGRASSSPWWAGRPAPASSTPSPSPSSPPSSVSTTSSGSSRRSRSPSSPGGARPRPWSPYLPTTSRSAWSPSRRRRPAPR